METKKEKITARAIEIIKANPNGIRYSHLVRKLQEELPETRTNTIHGTIWDLHVEESGAVYKPVRGVYRHVMFRDRDAKEEEAQQAKQPIPMSGPRVKEDAFYAPFADWLVNEVEECTKAIPLGGNRFKDKWGTPDVIGKRESLRSDVVVAPIEIVSAEIKTDSGDLIKAFGQACSYKLFSHKSYIVVPRSSSEDDRSRLDALCLIFGIGLVLFDGANPREPEFEIRVRPLKHEPDMFYVNKFMRMVEKELFGQ